MKTFEFLSVLSLLFFYFMYLYLFNFRFYSCIFLLFTKITKKVKKSYQKYDIDLIQRSSDTKIIYKIFFHYLKSCLTFSHCLKLKSLWMCNRQRIMSFLQNVSFLYFNINPKRERGNNGLFITLVPKVLHFLIRLLNNFGDFY